MPSDSPIVVPSAIDKKQASKDLLDLLDEAHENIRSSAATDAELSDAVEEAIKASVKTSQA